MQESCCEKRTKNQLFSQGFDQKPAFISLEAMESFLWIYSEKLQISASSISPIHSFLKISLQ